jgi:hypothetical protein
LALRNHDVQRTRELLDAQPELVGKGDKGSSLPIHWATMTRQLDAIDELLRRSADINALRMDGARPIHPQGFALHLSGMRQNAGEFHRVCRHQQESHHAAAGQARRAGTLPGFPAGGNARGRPTDTHLRR